MRYIASTSTGDVLIYEPSRANFMGLEEFGTFEEAKRCLVLHAELQVSHCERELKKAQERLREVQTLEHP